MLDLRPDLDPYTPGMLRGASFLIPSNEGGYVTARSETTAGYGTALNGACLGSRIVRKTDGTPRLLAGSASKIQEANGAGGWTDRSRTTAYTTGVYSWWFCPFDNSVIACNYANETQISTGAAFSDLSGAPKARIIVSQSRALLAMNYDDGSVVPNGIKISARGSATSWTASGSNDATAITLSQSEGPIMAGASMNDIVIAWKRRSMYIGRYVGGSEKWQFNILSQSIGCLGIEAWCYTPKGIIFASENGIFLFDGSVPRPIDQGVRKWLNITKGILSYNQGQDMFISHDEINNCVFLWYRTAVSTWYTIAYNYQTDKWGEPYSANVLASLSTIAGFEAAVRDSNYNDLILLSGPTNSARIGHLIFVASPAHTLMNLSGVPEGGASITTGRVRLPTKKSRSLTKVDRVFPVFTSDGECAQTTMGILSLYGARQATSADATKTSYLDTSNKSLDYGTVADNVSLNLSGGAIGVAGSVWGILDLEWELEPHGVK